MMTRKEASKILRDMLPGPIIPPVHLGSQKQEAIQVALAALRPVSREQVKKVWRGYWDHKEVISNKSITGKFLLPSCECSLCGCYVQQEVNFCPHCGAPMTDEAVEIRLKKLEALKDGSTTD